jgi:glutaminase
MSFDPSKLQSLVNDVHARHKDDTGGQNASYIPYLARVPTTLCALAVMTPDGAVVAAGDSDYRFAIESISKVPTLALALEDVGANAVQQKIGANPTGMAFNSVMALELHGGKPQSPLVNAGAMSCASIIDAKDVEDRWQRILNMQRDLLGANVALSAEVNESEQTTNFHNRAIAWLMYADGTMYADPMEVCDVYTRQCSTLITTIELATMAATLAARGRNPITGQQVLNGDHVPRVLAEMAMEGLYDSSGDWAYTVGLPAKSGVGGGIMAVAPGKLGIAAFSPPLDGVGNSVRAQKMIADVARALRLNLYDPS